MSAALESENGLPSILSQQQFPGCLLLFLAVVFAKGRVVFFLPDAALFFTVNSSLRWVDSNWLVVFMAVVVTGSYLGDSAHREMKR